MMPTLVTASIVTLVLNQGAFSFPWPRQATYFLIVPRDVAPSYVRGDHAPLSVESESWLTRVDQPREGPPRRLDESRLSRTTAFFCGRPSIFTANYALWFLDFLATVIHGTRYPTRSQHPHRNGNPETWMSFGNSGDSDGSDGIVIAQR